MPGVFLSHSSVDKDIILRLAIDLVNRGFPVWLDAWQMTIGDQLYDHIYEGIDQSSFLILALSKNSVKSDWVNDELNGALAKEAKMGRKFLIPIKVEECDVPLKIAGRIYADFGSGYFQGLDVLSAYLRKVGVDKAEGPVERELVPLEITRGTILNRGAFEQRLRMLQKRQEREFRISSRQIVLSPDPVYRQLRDRLVKNLEKSRTEAQFTIEDQELLFAIYQGVEKREQALLAGVTEIVNRFIGTEDSEYVGEVCFWLVKLVRNMLYCDMWMVQRKDDPPIIPLPDTCVYGMSSNREKWAQFLGVQEAAHFTIFRNDKGRETCGVWLDAGTSIARELVEYAGYDIHFNLKNVPGSVVFKFIIPQIQFRAQLSDDWTIENCVIRND